MLKDKFDNMFNKNNKEKFKNNLLKFIDKEKFKNNLVKSIDKIKNKEELKNNLIKYINKFKEKTNNKSKKNNVMVSQNEELENLKKQLNQLELIQFNEIFKFLKENILLNVRDVDIAKEIKLNDSTIFLQNNSLHSDYLNKIKPIFNTIIIETQEELEKLYSLASFQTIENVHFTPTSELKQELQLKKKDLSNKYSICEKELMIPLICKETGKNILAISKPNLNMINFYYEEIVLINISLVAQYFQLNGSKLKFLEGNNEKTSKDSANMIFQYMIDNRISDLEMYLHTQSFYGINIRKNGNLHNITQRIPLHKGVEIVEALLRLIGEEQKTTKPRVDKKYKYLDKSGYRQFRLSFIDQSKSGLISLKKYKSVDIRLLGDDSFIYNINNLGYAPKVIDMIRESIRTSHTGLYLIAGATNSGKTTTLYALLYDLYQYLNSIGESKKIKTIDSPLEYDIDGFVSVDIQDSIDSENPITISQAIQSFLRQDPDICAVTEMRSKEDFHAFMELGLRGHPTWGTLHTNSVKETVRFLEEQGGVSQMQLRSNLKLILHVDLTEKTCPECYHLEKNDKKTCIACDGSGILGVIPVYELVIFFQKGTSNYGFDPVCDDVYDFKKLSEEKKIVWITKEEVSKDLYERKLISIDDYYNYSGITTNNILSKMD